MMYIILLIYFVNIVCGDDSSEAKYIDLLPEKEKEEFLETVARRIFDNIKHKNAIPEREEHTKLIEKVLQESLNLKRVSQNTSDDSDGKDNAVEEGDALDLTQEGKRNKRNSLKENKSSDIVPVQRASKEINKANFNELSKELGVSDTEDIEVKHTNNKQTEVSNEKITTESKVEGIGTEITVRDVISKKNSSVRDNESNYEPEGKTTKSPTTTSKPEAIRDTNKEATESIETTKTTEHSYSTTERTNVTSRRNGNSEPTNDSSEKDTKQVPIAINVIISSPDVKLKTFGEAVENNVTKALATNADIKPTANEEKNVAFANTIMKIVTTSSDIKSTETTTELSKINETRKAYDKLASNFDTDNITLDDIRDDKDNEGTKAVIDDKTLTTKTVVTVNNVTLDNSYFDDESTAAVIDKNQNHTHLNDLASSIKENYESMTEKINSTNSVTKSENKDIKSSETIVSGTDNSNETIIKVIKNSKDYIKIQHRINETAVNENNGTTLESNINSMASNSNVKRDTDIITTTTMGTLINNNKEINIENSSEKTQYKSNGIVGILIEAKTSKEILNDRHQEIEMKNSTVAVSKINHDKTEASSFKEVITESINNITIIHDNSAEKIKNNSAEIEPDKNIIGKNTIDSNESTTSKTYIKTTTVKIETGGILAEVSIKSNQMRNGPEIVKTTGEEILIDQHQGIEMKNNTAVVPKLNKNKTEASFKEMITESINITIEHDNSTEKNKSNSAENKPDNKTIKKNTVENNEGTTSETYIETTTVKIETLTIATDINKSEANDKDFIIKEDAKPYINQDKKSINQIPKMNHKSVKVFDNDYDEMGKKVVKIEKSSDNFVNDMIKVLRLSISDKTNQVLKPLRLLNDNPKPKEYKVYKTPNNKLLNQNHEAKDNNVIEENPYYVPVYNYGAEHAYYNPKNRLGPNADDDDVTIIKNAGSNVESIAQDYDSIIKDSGYENDYTNNYQNRQDSNDNVARNDVDYDEAFNKEREFIDRMGDVRGSRFNNNKKLRSKDTENTQNIKKVEYMKNLVKIYKNRNGKNKNKQRSLGRYKLNLPIVVNYPKYSDIIMNSHDYLDIDYRYPKWKKPKNSRSRKHRLIRTSENQFPKGLIITSFADDPEVDEEGTVSVANPNSHDKYKDDSNMLSDETQNQETEKPYKIRYDDDYANYVDKPLVNNYGRPNSINLFESGEYVWETQDTKKKRNKKIKENEKSLGIKNQIRKIREMMYSSANFGFKKSKEVEKTNYHGVKDFIKEAPKMCDGEDPDCIEPFLLIKQAHSGRHAMNNSIASDYFIARTNNASDSVVDYVPKLSARTKDFTFDNSMKSIEKHEILITWITDFSQIQDQLTVKSDCSFCSNDICHTCVCVHFSQDKFCIVPDTNDDKNKDNNIPKPTENTINENFSDNSDWDIVKNISMLPSYLDPIIKHKHEQYKQKPMFRSRNDKLPPKNSLRNEDSLEDNSTKIHVSKPNIMKFKSPDQFQDAVNPYPLQEIETSDTKTDRTPEKTPKHKYNKIDTVKSIMEIIPDDVELMLKVSAMFENSEERESDIKKEKSNNTKKKLLCLRSVVSTDLESYVTVLEDMVHNEAKGLIQYDWMGTSIDIQAAVFKLKEMTESVKNNEVLDNLDFKLLKYFTFLHKFSTKRQDDLRMILPKPKYKYNRTRSQRGVFSRIWLKSRLKKFAFEVSGIDLYYFVEFLDELQFYLYDLHTALTQIALVTSYKNQNWFKNLSELYLDNSRKNILELLLHVTTVRLLDLVENSVQSGLQDGFLRYVMSNEKETERSKNELVLILKIIEELKRIQ